MKGSFDFTPIGKTTLEGLIALANPSVEPPLNLSEVTVGVPLANAGDKNTRLNLVFKPDGRFTGPVDFFYDRIDLAVLPNIVKETLSVGPLGAGVIPTAGSVLSLFEQKYGIDFELNDVNASIPSVITGTNFSHAITLTANPNSLVWKGSVTVKVLRNDIIDLKSVMLSAAAANGILYLNGLPSKPQAGTYGGIFCDETVAPFDLYYGANADGKIYGLTKLADVEQRVIDIVNAHGQRCVPPTPFTLTKDDVTVVRRPNSHKIMAYRQGLTWKAMARTSFLVRAKESSAYTGTIPFVGWELIDISEYLSRDAVPTIYFQSGQQIDILKLLPRIKDAYNLELDPTEVEQTAGEPKPGLTSGYTLDLVMNKTSLYFSGSHRFTVDVSGDPYRYINNAYLSDFAPLTWNNI